MSEGGWRGRKHLCYETVSFWRSSLRFELLSSCPREGKEERLKKRK